MNVFVQKGYKAMGSTTLVQPPDLAFERSVHPLRALAGEHFPIHSVFVVRATAIEPIVASSYRLYPTGTTEAAQVEAALRDYGVNRNLNSN